MNKDRFSCYADLRAAKFEGRDYRVWAHDLDTAVVILAPHGGCIEPGTSEIATAVAGTSCSLYLFEGLVRQGGHREQHICSERFDEPRGLTMVAKAITAVAIHGRADGEDPETIWIGGLDKALGASISSALRAHGFSARTNPPRLNGTDPSNVCNRTRSGRGVRTENDTQSPLRRSRPHADLCLCRPRFDRRTLLFGSCRELKMRGPVATGPPKAPYRDCVC